MIVAIDGPSGTGKSTVAKLVTERLGFIYFNTGAMYRSFAIFASNRNIDPNDVGALVEALEDFSFDIVKVGDEDRYLVNGEDLSRRLYLEEVSKMASVFSAHKEVRERLLPIQRSFGASHNAVFEGRDIGTVVFPHARVKIFLTAKAEIRAERRLAQLKEKYPDQNYEFSQILQEIQARDMRDTTRSIAPLKKAEDAVEIDTSELNIDQVVEKIVGLCHDR